MQESYQTAAPAVMIIHSKRAVKDAIENSSLPPPLVFVLNPHMCVCDGRAVVQSASFTG